MWAIYLFQCRRRTTSSSRKMQGQYLCLISSVSDSLIFRNRQHNMYIFEWFYETNSYFADHRRRCTLRSNFRLNAPTETSSFCVGKKRVKSAPWLFLQFFAQSSDFSSSVFSLFAKKNVNYICFNDFIIKEKTTFLHVRSHKCFQSTKM